MKAILEFNLPEDQDAFKLANTAGDLHSACWDFAEWMRGICKHGDPEKVTLEECKDKFYGCLRDCDVTL